MGEAEKNNKTCKTYTYILFFLLQLTEYQFRLLKLYFFWYDFNFLIVKEIL